MSIKPVILLSWLQAVRKLASTINRLSLVFEDGQHNNTAARAATNVPLARLLLRVLHDYVDYSIHPRLLHVRGTARARDWYAIAGTYIGITRGEQLETEQTLCFRISRSIFLNFFLNFFRVWNCMIAKV